MHILEYLFIFLNARNICNPPAMTLVLCMLRAMPLLSEAVHLRDTMLTGFIALLLVILQLFACLGSKWECCGLCSPGRRVGAAPGCLAGAWGCCAARRALAKSPRVGKETSLGLQRLLGSSRKRKWNEDLEKGRFISIFFKYFPTVDLHFLSLESCVVLVFCPNTRDGKLFDVLIESVYCVLRLSLNPCTVTFYFN